MRWLLAVVATLAFAPAAYAQGATIQAGAADVAWSPPNVTIKAGETVTWTWAGFHNVKATSDNWKDVQGDTSPFVRPFDTPGTYTFVCQFHAAQGMTGSVTVTDSGGTPPPPPPPPPPSQQPWANDQQAPSALELARDLRPRLSRVRVTAVRHGARVRFTLSERARVVVRLKLAGLAVKTARRTFRAGDRTLTVRDRRLQGRYVVEVSARDRAGKRSKVKRDRLTIR